MLAVVMTTMSIERVQCLIQSGGRKNEKRSQNCGKAGNSNRQLCAKFNEVCLKWVSRQQAVMETHERLRLLLSTLPIVTKTSASFFIGSGLKKKTLWGLADTLA